MTSEKPSPFAAQAKGEDITRITGSLPNVDLEIVRREDPAGESETVTITMRARPGFDAVAAAMLPSLLSSGLNPGALWGGLGASPLLLGAAPSQNAEALAALNPFALWQQIGEQMMTTWMSAWMGQGNPFVEMMQKMSGVPLCTAGKAQKR